MTAEQAVLGAILQSRDALYTVQQIISKEDFQDERHQAAYLHMLDLERKNQPIDFATMQPAIDAAYAIELVEHTPSVSAVGHYATLLKRQSLRRQIAEAGKRILQLSQDESEEPEELLARAQEAVLGLGRNDGSGSPVPLSEILARLVSKWEAAREPGAKRLGRPTGIRGLDDIVDGFGPGEMIVIAGPAGSGKSSLAQQILLNQAGMDSDFRAIVFSAEMDQEECGSRTVGAWGHIDARALKRGVTSDEEILRAQEVCRELAEFHISVVDSGAFTPSHIASVSRSMKARQGLDAIVVDHLGLIKSDRRTDSKYAEVTECSREMKLLAQDLKIPVIVLAQLNRSFANREDPRPRLSDLRDSGAIEQDANRVIFVYREHVLNKEADPRTAELILAKNRHGPIGTVNVNFDPNATGFYDD